MIKCVDLKTGNIYKGEAPYIHWFDDQQSVNMMYVKKVCLISDKMELSIKMEVNNIFSILDLNMPSNYSLVFNDFYDINRFKVLNGEYISVGSEYDGTGNYIHMIYIYGSTNVAGEYIQHLIIDGDNYLIGADFYDEEESLCINLLNKGCEIPNSIQKAFYNTNVFEDFDDNITLNRKWKELLSNYIDVLDNKGSYKSLVNSLKWFEYGDKLKVYTAWKYMDRDKYWMCIKDIVELMKDKCLNINSTYTQTTYISLAMALKEYEGIDQSSVDFYDENKNPKLKSIVYKWANADMAMKLCFLNRFFQVYFMPIHLDVLYATMEDTVYTDPIGVISKTKNYRIDTQYYTDDITCNVQNGDIFYMDTVKCQVGPETVFGVQWNGKTSYNNINIIGVDDIVDRINNDNDAKTFYSQLYRGTGCVIPFELRFPLVSGDAIKKSIIYFKHNPEGEFIKCEDYHLYCIVDKTIKFNLLCKHVMDYEIRLQFESLQGHIYTKRIKFTVKDDNHYKIKLYRLTPKNPLNLTDDDAIFDNNSLSLDNPDDPRINWVLRRKPFPAETSEDFITQYITTKENLHHMMIFKPFDNEDDWLPIKAMLGNYYIFTEISKKNNENLDSNVLYHVAICKDPGTGILDNTPVPLTFESSDGYNYLYRDSFVFCPQLFDIEEIGNTNTIPTIDDYKVNINDVICATTDLKYSEHIVDMEWEFINTSNVLRESYTLPSMKTTYIRPMSGEELTPGYYDIVFKYKFKNSPQRSIKLTSSFIYENIHPESGS